MFRPEHMCWSCSWRTTGALTRGTRIRCASWAEPAPPESEQIQRFGSALWKNMGKLRFNLQKQRKMQEHEDFISKQCGQLGFHQQQLWKYWIQPIKIPEVRHSETPKWKT